MLSPVVLDERAHMPDMAEVMGENWVSVTEAAERLNVSTKTVYRHIHADTFPCRAVRLGRIWRIRAADIDQYIAYLDGGEPS